MPTGKISFKERSARRAIRVARKEGLAVNSVEVSPDGTIRIHTTDGTTTPNQTNPWDEVLPDAAHQERTS